MSFIHVNVCTLPNSTGLGILRCQLGVEYSYIGQRRNKCGTVDEEYKGKRPGGRRRRRCEDSKANTNKTLLLKIVQLVGRV
jgi:hypothetical protein